jgi:hypothetical protein
MNIPLISLPSQTFLVPGPCLHPWLSHFKNIRIRVAYKIMQLLVKIVQLSQPLVTSSFSGSSIPYSSLNVKDLVSYI